MPLLDRLGTSTGWLLVLILLGAVLAFVGSRLGGSLETLLTFLAGAIVAVAVCSWQINASFRRRARAFRLFWEAFAADAAIVLATQIPGDEISPLTPLHDALACALVQGYLRLEFGAELPIVAASDIESLETAPARNLILIGGPKFNRLTMELMERVWTQNAEGYFQWSSMIGALADADSLVHPDDGHRLLRIRFTDDGPQVIEAIDGIRDGSGGPLEARGMCLRLRGAPEPGRQILALAGVDSAFGTLASADYVTNPDNLVQLSEGNRQAIIGARMNGSNVATPELLRLVEG